MASADSSPSTPTPGGDYLGALGLDSQPFGLAPDLRFLVDRHDHREALARVLFGLSEIGGIVLVTGEIGSGKTILAHTVRRFLDGEGFSVVAVANPPRTPAALLAALHEAAGGPEAGGSSARLSRLLRDRMERTAAEGRLVVLLVDEAQRLNAAALEELRLLTNPDEGPGAGLVLLGQPELTRHVDRLPQVSQRIVVRYHLGGMDRDELETYLDRRARAAGASGGLFTTRAARAIHEESGGVPRVANLLAANALFIAASRGQSRVDKDVVKDVIDDRREARSAAEGIDP